MIHLPVDPDDLPRVRGVLGGSIEPRVARPAVSVVLVRDSPDGLDGAGGPGGLEALLLRRNPRLAFAAGYYVFPGGSLDPGDAIEAPWRGPVPEHPEVVVAGVRETFEECGVLLAVDVEGRPAAVDASAESDRLALESGAEPLAAVLHRRGLALDAAMLAPLAHWVTPIAEKRRFDTRFLLAVLPDGQATRDIIGEADLQAWMRPRDALHGGLPLMPPTRAVLRTLADEPSAAEALARPRTFERIQPEVRLDGDRLELLLP